jgi:hypothetical protein
MWVAFFLGVGALMLSVVAAKQGLSSLILEDQSHFQQFM